MSSWAFKCASGAASASRVTPGSWILSQIRACRTRSKTVPWFFCAQKGSSLGLHAFMPRVCGEKPSTILVPLNFLGSPPRVRGKVSGGRGRESASRITPACAGKRAAPGTARCRKKDHPRVCGEKPPDGCSHRGGCRITPACAGKRSDRRPWMCRKKDHPRVCGEKTASDDVYIPVTRITPACAGKRHIHRPRWHDLGDHPRVCGEKPVEALT